MQPLPNEISQTAAHLFRHESGKMLAVLVKLFGLQQVEIAEDIVQETLLTALEAWKTQGIPDNPRAWMYRVAKNKTIDYLRRQGRFEAKVSPDLLEMAKKTDENQIDHFFLDHEIEDAQLRMMFACCHPDIPEESQLALMLRTLCGLSVREIAAAFLLPEDNIAKRIFRAKEKIRQSHLSLETPTGEGLLPRLDAVLQAIYLLFNEGYKSTSEGAIIRHELCSEALRLGNLLTRNPIGDLPKTNALQALMCFQAARFPARLDDAGQIILLEHQDRSSWDRTLIGHGYAHFRRATTGQNLSEYHLEAAIASYHTAARTFDHTNWKAIFYCYDLLLTMNPAPIIALQRAIALGFSEGPKAGIEALLTIKGLEKNYLYHTALGDFLVKNKQVAAAKSHYETALNLVLLPAELRVLETKLLLLPIIS